MQAPGKSIQLGVRRHKKSYSTDTLATNSSRKKFISVVSSGFKKNENATQNQGTFKGVAELKEAAMGVKQHRRRESRGITLRIKQSNVPEHGQQEGSSLGVKDRMRAFKQRLSNLYEPETPTLSSVVATPPLGTPINRLLFESTCKENY